MEQMAHRELNKYERRESKHKGGSERDKKTLWENGRVGAVQTSDNPEGTRHKTTKVERGTPKKREQVLIRNEIALGIILAPWKGRTFGQPTGRKKNPSIE